MILNISESLAECYNIANKRQANTLVPLSYVSWS